MKKRRQRRCIGVPDITYPNLFVTMRFEPGAFLKRVRVSYLELWLGWIRCLLEFRVRATVRAKVRARVTRVRNAWVRKGWVRNVWTPVYCVNSYVMLSLSAAAVTTLSRDPSQSYAPLKRVMKQSPTVFVARFGAYTSLVQCLSINRQHK